MTAFTQSYQAVGGKLDNFPANFSLILDEFPQFITHNGHLSLQHDIFHGWQDFFYR